MFVDAMSGIPSICAGLFIYAVWVLRFGFSGFAAALALSILMLPTVTRTSEEVLRLVPDGLREASLAAGASEWRTTWSVVLPTARSGLVTAVLLGVARAVGDTAALIATAAGLRLAEHQPVPRAAGQPAALHLQADPHRAHRRADRSGRGPARSCSLMLGARSSSPPPASSPGRRPRRASRTPRSLTTEVSVTTTTPATRPVAALDGSRAGRRGRRDRWSPKSVSAWFGTQPGARSR